MYTCILNGWLVKLRIGLNCHGNALLSDRTLLWCILALDCVTIDKRYSSSVTGLAWPRGFQEVKVPRFHDNGTGWW
jgi:hypothetical protein